MEDYLILLHIGVVVWALSEYSRGSLSSQ